MGKHIAVLAFDGISTFHLSVPYTVFGEDRQSIGIPPYEIFVCAVRPGMIRTSMGLEMEVREGLEALARADIVVIPSWKDIERASPVELMEALRTAHHRGAKIVGLCLGAFPVAEAGLLDGRTGTTHWAWADIFARRFPRVALDSHVLYIDHGDVITSAGAAAALDCCLHLLRTESGAELANRLARRLVIPPHRQGSQAQYVEQTLPGKPGSDRMARTLEWMHKHLEQELDIDALASYAAMSRRTFTRHFQKATGMSVVQWVRSQRLFMAQRLLETTNIPIEQVASHTGFGSALSLRLVFTRELNTTPSQYRREFNGRSPEKNSEN